MMTPTANASARSRVQSSALYVIGGLLTALGAVFFLRANGTLVHKQEQGLAFKRGDDEDPRVAAYRLAMERFRARFGSDDVSEAPRNLTMLAEGMEDMNNPKSVNSIRVPKAGSSHLSVIARALAGCAPDGMPCCNYPGNPKGSCPTKGLLCPFVRGCVDHRPKYQGFETVPMITALRRPDERLVSAFFYYPPHCPKNLTDHSFDTFAGDDYLANPQYRNVMVKMFSVKGDYAYHEYNASIHKLADAKYRLCQSAWFSVEEQPIPAQLLLYEPVTKWTHLSQILPNPVVFDLTVEGTVKNQTAGLRVDTDDEYTRFKETDFVMRNGPALVEEYNREDGQLYEFARGLFCARLRAAGDLIDVAMRRLIAIDQFRACDDYPGEIADFCPDS